MNLKSILSNPINIFLFTWLLIIFTYQLKIAYFFPEYSIKEFAIPILCIFYFVLGFETVKILQKPQKQKVYKLYLSKQKFNMFISFLITMSLLIVIMNIEMFGLPPMMSFFGYDTSVYLEYGRFKGVLFALLIFIFIVSLYATKKISYLMKLFSIIVLLLYVSRGNIIFSIITYFFLLIYENKINNKKLLILLSLFIIFTLLLFQILGELRTGTETFYNVLEIKDAYRLKNSGLIWLIAYISMPFANFLEVTNYNNLYYGQNIISSSLPAFLSFNSASIEFYKSIIPNQYNTVATYLVHIYLDFGIIGVIVYNYFLGIFASYLYHFSTNNLIKSIFLTVISLLFFIDYFFFFTTIVLIVLSVVFNKFVLKKVYET